MEPSVAVIIAALDERDTIDAALDAATGAPMVREVIVADGGSTDGTLARVEERSSRDPRIRLIHNPHRHQSAGLNMAARVTDSDLLIRLDAHTAYADDYIERSISAWRPGRAVGGPMRAAGTEPWPEAIANAMHDPLAVGPAPYRHASAVQEVDTVYLGAFERSAFLATGGYRRFPSGTVEDADFYHRWKVAGRKVEVHPDIRSTYHPRRSWSSLWRQYRRYGEGKAEMLWVNGRLPSPRALGPAALTVGLAVGVGVSVVAWRPALVVVAAPWLVALAIVGTRAPTRRWRTAAAAGTMHLAYGLGTWIGAVRGRPTVTAPGMDDSDGPGSPG